MNARRALTPPPDPQDRTWTHPSELGLAVRGRSDRRRSSVIAAGVVLGGLGLLLSGVLVGSGGGSVSAVSDPVQRIERSVVSVELVRSSGRSTVLPGLVLDSDGHVLVADPLTGVSSVRVVAADGEPVRALRVASDSDGMLGVVSTGAPLGAPATVAPRVPDDGTDVVVTRVHAAGTEHADAVLDRTLPGATQLQLVGTTPTGAHDLVFDRSGRLVGMAATPGPRDADEAVAIAVPGDHMVAFAHRLLGGR